MIGTKDCEARWEECKALFSGRCEMWSRVFEESAYHAVLSWLCEDFHCTYQHPSFDVPQGWNSRISSQSILLDFVSKSACFHWF